MLGAFFLANALPEFLWSNFPPIMTEVASRYGVGETAASLPVISFSVGTVLSAGAAGRLIDGRGYRFSLRVGLLLLALFACLRAVEGPLWLLVLAQGGIGAAFSFVVSGTSSCVADWFEGKQEAIATGVCMVGLFFGLGSSMIVTPLLVDAYGFAGMMRVTAAGTVILFVLLAPWIRQRRVFVAAAQVAVDWRRLFANRTLLLQFIISFLQQGVFSAIATALEIVWSGRGFSSQQAGLANGLFIFGGMAGSFLLPAVQDRLCSGRVLLIICYSTALLLSWPLLVSSSLLQGCVIAFVVGVFWLGSVPVALVMIERAAGAEHAGAASSAFWAFGSAGAVALVWVFALLTEVSSWQAGTLAMLALLLINLGATWALPRSSHA